MHAVRICRASCSARWTSVLDRGKVVVTTAPYNRRGERADGSLYPEDQPARVQESNSLRKVAAKRPNVSVLDFNAKLNPGGSYREGRHPDAQ